MTRTNPIRRPIGLLSVCGLACLASVAFAQSQPTSPKDDPMRGPEIRDRQVPGVTGSFGEGGSRRRMAGEAKIPPRVFQNAMQAIMDPDAPEDVRVTEEQRERFQDWMDNFQKSVSDYMKQHPELRELRRKSGDQGGPRRPNAEGRRPDGAPRGPESDKRPDAMQPDGMQEEPMREETKEAIAARERVQTIMAGAPKIEDLYTKIWAELKPAQQKAVDAKLDEFRARQAKEREDNYVRQRAKKQDGNQPAPGAPDARKRPGAESDRPDAPKRPAAGAGAEGQPPARDAQRGQVDPQKRERLMRLFSRLTPEQQEQLLQRLESMRDGQGNPQIPGRPGRRGGEPGRPERKPAPEPDDSMMPPAPAGR